MVKIKSNFNYFLRRTSQLIQKLPIPTNSLCIKYNDFRHNIIERELSPYFNKSFNVLKKQNYNSFYENENHDNERIIWTFWWQGKESMPLLVKKCIDSIKRHSNNYKVILITKENIKQYAKLPNYIYKALDKSNISLTHFSDILRFNLLRNYGGLWSDSTIYFTSDIDDKYFKNFYTANVGYDKNHFSVTQGKWTSFLIGGSMNQPLFVFMDIFYKYYWTINSDIIDYFMMDYALNYAYSNNIGNFKQHVDHCDYQPYIFYLMQYMENQFDFNMYNKIVQNSDCFKLTYKKNISQSRNTFFYKFIHDEI